MMNEKELEKLDLKYKDNTFGVGSEFYEGWGGKGVAGLYSDGRIVIERGFNCFSFLFGSIEDYLKKLEKEHGNGIEILLNHACDRTGPFDEEFSWRHKYIAEIFSERNFSDTMRGFQYFIHNNKFYADGYSGDLGSVPDKDYILGRCIEGTGFEYVGGLDNYLEGRK